MKLPVAGRLADAGHSVRATLIALVVGALAFTPALIHPAWGVGALVVTAIVLDLAVQMNTVLGQREIHALHAASRIRLNALYMMSIFIDGALGSALASSLYEHGGWTLIAIVASVFPLIALLHYLVIGKPIEVATVRLGSGTLRSNVGRTALSGPRKSAPSLRVARSVHTNMLSQRALGTRDAQ
jgi:predicted MFS family arabinose efflux permease